VWKGFAVSEPKLQLAGTESFPAAREAVFDLLTDLDQLAGNIPDLESAQRVDERTLACVVRPGFSFMRGKVNLTIRLVKQVRPESAEMETEMKGIGQAMQAESSIALRPTEGGCQLDWEVRVVQLKGLIATVSPGLVKAAAQRIIEQSYARVREKLSSPSQKT
jgi:carbon monoxide dehydrogenase subunit G